MSAKYNQPSGETFHSSQLTIVGIMLLYPQYSVVAQGYFSFTLSVHLSLSVRVSVRPWVCRWICIHFITSTILQLSNYLIFGMEIAPMEKVCCI